jgi:hypothetical protein
MIIVCIVGSSQQISKELYGVGHSMGTAMAWAALHRRCDTDGSRTAVNICRLHSKLCQVLSYLTVIESVMSIYAGIRGCDNGLTHGSYVGML